MPLLLLGWSISPAVVAGFSGHVVGVRDGDTLTVLVDRRNRCARLEAGIRQSLEAIPCLPVLRQAHPGFGERPGSEPFFVLDYQIGVISLAMYQ